MNESFTALEVLKVLVLLPQFITQFLIAAAFIFQDKRSRALEKEYVYWLTLAKYWYISKV